MGWIVDRHRQPIIGKSCAVERGWAACVFGVVTGGTQQRVPPNGGGARRPAFRRAWSAACAWESASSNRGDMGDVCNSSLAPPAAMTPSALGGRQLCSFGCGSTSGRGRCPDFASLRQGLPAARFGSPAHSAPGALCAGAGRAGLARSRAQRPGAWHGDDVHDGALLLVLPHLRGGRRQRLGLLGAGHDGRRRAHDVCTLENQRAVTLDAAEEGQQVEVQLGGRRGLGGVGGGTGR
jgi:hypothetical protein